jgi:hypothetical protein
VGVQGVPEGLTELRENGNRAFYRDSWGSLRDYGYLRKLTTNQKAAGSSPAERTTKYLQMKRFCVFKSVRRLACTIRLTTYLIPNGFEEGACTCDLDVPVLDPEYGYIMRRYLAVPGYNNSSGGIEHSVPVEEGTGLDRPSDRFPCLDI